MPKKSKSLCVDDLRHAEYYDMQTTFDTLYQVAGATASPRYVITLLFLKNSVFLNKSSSF